MHDNKCPYCFCISEEQWFQDVNNAYTFMRECYGKSGFLEKQKELKKAVNQGTCKCSSKEEMLKVLDIHPFDKETTPYPFLLAEIEDRIPELHRQKTEQLLKKYNEQKAKEQASHQLYQQEKREWSRLCKDEDMLYNLTTEERHEGELEYYKIHHKERDNSFMVERYELLQFSKKLSDVTEAGKINGYMEDILLRLCDGHDWAILRGNK